MRHKYIVITTTSVIALLSWAAILMGAPTPVTVTLGVALFAALGYVWARVILGDGLWDLQRVAIAAGLALAAPVLGGLALRAAGVLLDPDSWVDLLASLTLVGDVALLLRYRAAPRLASATPARHQVSAKQGLAFAAALVIAAGAIGLARIGATKQQHPGFTELWLTAHARNANVASLGVRNLQGSPEHYRLVVLHDSRISAVWNLTLTNGKVWQRLVPINSDYVTAANLYLLPDLHTPYRHVITAPGGTAGK